MARNEDYCFSENHSGHCWNDQGDRNLFPGFFYGYQGGNNPGGAGTGDGAAPVGAFSGAAGGLVPFSGQNAAVGGGTGADQALFWLAVVLVVLAVK